MKPDWPTLTHGQRVDYLKPLLLDGFSYGRIATAFENATKNAVLGFCYRIGLRHDNAHSFALPAGREGFRAHVRKSGVQERRGSSTYREAVFLNEATDPETRAIVDEINASGFYTYDIAAVAGVNRNTITYWRRGKRKSQAFLRQCAREAIRRLQADPSLRLHPDRPLPGEVLSGVSEMTCDTAKR